MLKIPKQERVETVENVGRYVRGHVTPERFAQLIREQDDGEYEVFAERALTESYHTWLRYNPDPSGEFLYLVANGTPGKQGSFRATFLDFDQNARFSAYTAYISPAASSAQEVQA